MKSHAETQPFAHPEHIEMHEIQLTVTLAFDSRSALSILTNAKSPMDREFLLTKTAFELFTGYLDHLNGMDEKGRPATEVIIGLRPPGTCQTP